MRVGSAARSLIFATTTAGLAAVVVAGIRAADTSLSTLALLGAAVVLTELLQVSREGSSVEPEAHHFSFSSAVHLAAVAIVGPWAAALVAAFGVVTVDRTGGKPWVRVLFNASVFALAATAGGFAFLLAGGEPGTLTFPADLGPVVALTLVYSVVNSVLVSAVVALTSGRSPWIEIRDNIRVELPPRAAEAGLGIAAAFAALTEPWAVVPLIPLVYSVYQAHARLMLLRRETERALETFANVVDERDSSTFRHSERVAEHIRGLAEALGLRPEEVARLRWAGRLHDLGKIAVDAGVLRKPAALSDEEWRVMRRHPRLSARLLRSFRFAAGQAQAVEYHHERFDGNGYYGIEGDSLMTLAAHFIVVADSFDAMTSERPYRLRLTTEAALVEIERGAGAQFHPLIAKTFVAHKRGLDPLAGLASAEREQLRRLTLVPRKQWFDTILEHRRMQPAAVSLAGLLCALAGLGFESLAVAATGAMVAAAGLGWREVAGRRARALAARLTSLLEPGLRQDEGLVRLASALAAVSGLTWAGLVEWSSETLDGRLVAEWGSQHAKPGDSALVSWLVREADVDSPLVARGAELGRDGAFLALPLDGGSYAVFAFPAVIDPHVESALHAAVRAFPKHGDAPIALHPRSMAAAS